MDDSDNTIGTENGTRYGKGNDRYDLAVREFVAEFTEVPGLWVHHVANKIDDVMLGFLFFVNNPDQVRKIRKLLRPIEHEVLGSIHEVGATGVLAWEVDDDLTLGIYGDGFDFYAEHWSKLYDALDYRWHEMD